MIDIFQPMAFEVLCTEIMLIELFKNRCTYIEKPRSGCFLTTNSIAIHIGNASSGLGTIMIVYL